MSTTDTESQQARLEAENKWLRGRVAALEAELLEVQQATNAAIAHWQERAYWLERWQLDLNAFMRRRGAMKALAMLRLLRSGMRMLERSKQRLSRER